MMMTNKPLLHELLKEDQEPFQLYRYIADRRSQLAKKPKRAGSLSRRSCFFSFQNSPDVRKSPFRDLPLSSPHRAAFLHIPTKTAAHLSEAAMRIQKQRQSKAKSQTLWLGLGLLGSFLRRLKDRSMNRKRAIGSSDYNVTAESPQETVRISSHRSKRRLSSTVWTENNEDNSLDFETSTSGYGSNCDFDFPESRNCASPFRFSYHMSPSSTPNFCSPVASPCRPAKILEEIYESGNSDQVLVGQEEEEDKERSSPVSVLDPPFDDDDGTENVDADEEEDYDVECSYINVQRAKEQLLYRLQRFEKLAELDPMELEKKLLEESDIDDSGDQEKFEDVDLIQSNSCSIQYHSSNTRIDLIKPPFDGGLTPINWMTGLDLEHKTWTKFDEQVGETAVEIEVAVFGVLVEELSEDLSCYYIHDNLR